MIKTFKELQNIDSVVGSLYKKNPELRDTKFGYAYKRFYEKNYSPIFKEFTEQINDSYIDNALVDERTQALLTDQDNSRGFKYSKDGLKKVMKDENKITEEFNKREIEIEPFISSYVPELTEDEKEILIGTVI